MSWGERSCKHKPCIIPDECDYGTCNVNCRMYEWDERTKPDSLTHVQQIRKEIADGTLEDKAIVCKRNKWNKKKGNKLFGSSNK